YKSAATPSFPLLKTMGDAMAHRGPDGDGFYASGACGLAHRRLSIIDLEGGKQPLSNEDGKVWVSFNGEIYNYKPLAAELAERGHRFRTRCDTETIVHAYEDRGARCVVLPPGLFAFAMLVGLKQACLLARYRV